jgi:hypothetical protein
LKTIPKFTLGYYKIQILLNWLLLGVFECRPMACDSWRLSLQWERYGIISSLLPRANKRWPQSLKQSILQQWPSRMWLLVLSHYAKKPKKFLSNYRQDAQTLKIIHLNGLKYSLIYSFVVCYFDHFFTFCFWNFLNLKALPCKPPSKYIRHSVYMMHNTNLSLLCLDAVHAQILHIWDVY